MNLTIEKARPEDAAEILDFLKQIGGETDNLTFGAEGMPFTVKAEAEYKRARKFLRQCNAYCKRQW